MDKLIAAFIILLGVNFLLDNFDLPRIDIGALFKLWPLALIWVGVSMWRDSTHKHDR